MPCEVDIAAISQNLNKKIFPISADLYEKRVKTENELMNDERIVVLDQRGFPKPKTKVENWNNTLLKESGFQAVLSTLEEVMK